MTFAQDYSSFDMISAPIFVLEVSADGEPVYAAVNAHARQMTGRPASDYIGKTALDVYPLAYGRVAYARHCEVMQSGKTMTYEIDLPLGGAIAAIRTTLRPEIDSAGRVLRLFGSSVDMTAEKNAREAKVEFDTLSSEMEQFVAFAAHDLRAPMRNISVLTGMMREELADTDDAKLEIIDLIDNITVQSMDLIRDVLSHAQNVSSEKHETVFSFPALCHSICDALDPKHMHSVTSSLHTLKADRTAIQIALRNLTENAIKHGQRDTLKIDIAVQPGLPGMIEVTLTDNGRGFSEGALKVMNGGQFRADSGYGLFGVKRLISARGGTLVGRNLPGDQGAVVRFSLPGAVVGKDASLGDPVEPPVLLRPATGDSPKKDRRFSA